MLPLMPVTMNVCWLCANEAENQQKELFGDERLLDSMTGLVNLTSHQVIDKLKVAVEQHRNGAEPNDDLTMMYISIKD